MKTPIILLLLTILHLTCFSQTADELIKISDDIELIKLSDDAYIHVSYHMSPQWGRIGANGFLLVDGNQAFLFDTPWDNEQTETLCGWITDSMKLEIIGFIPNHWHEDCMGGLKTIQQRKIKSYANQITIDIAKAQGMPVPEQGFKDSLELILGDKEIKCYYPGAAHSMDNIVVWIPSEQILFAACMVKSMNSGNLGNTADGDLNAYPKTIKKLVEKFPTAKIVIPGHGQYGGMELVNHTLEMASNSQNNP